MAGMTTWGYVVASRLRGQGYNLRGVPIEDWLHAFGSLGYHIAIFCGILIRAFDKRRVLLYLLVAFRGCIRAFGSAGLFLRLAIDT